MRIRDWSSDVCSSDLPRAVQAALSKAGLTAADVDKFIFPTTLKGVEGQLAKSLGIRADAVVGNLASQVGDTGVGHGLLMLAGVLAEARPGSVILMLEFRSEEHTSELQSLMRISYAVFCLKQNNKNIAIYRHK